MKSVSTWGALALLVASCALVNAQQKQDRYRLSTLSDSSQTVNQNRSNGAVHPSTSHGADYRSASRLFRFLPGNGGYFSTTAETIEPGYTVTESSPSDANGTVLVEPINGGTEIGVGGDDKPYASVPSITTLGCATCGGGLPCCNCPCWYVGLYGLVMTRDDENSEYFSYSDENEAIQLLNSREARIDWAGGFEARLGRTLHGCCYGLEAIYWGLFPEENESNTLLSRDINPGFNLRTTFDFTGLLYDAGDGFGPQAVSVWFDNNVARHRIRRDNDFHNVELNLVRQPLFVSAWGYAPAIHGFKRGVNAGWLAGFRFLKFDEHFQFASDRANEVFGDNAFDEMFFDIEVDNNLIGAQVGGHLEYGLNGCLNFTSELKMGVYGNHITHTSRIGGANGVATVGAGPNAGRPYDVDFSKNDVAFIGELKLGLAYHFYKRWVMTGGYRAVALTGVALATNQIPRDLRGIDDVINVDSNGSLILHGSYAGIEYSW